MTRWLSLVLLAVLTGHVQGQSVKLPAEAKGAPGVPVMLVAEADGANVVWLTPDQGITLIDGGFFGGDSKRALAWASPGTYRVWALTAKGDRISPRAECTVVISGTPVPPTPPTPPDPPKPPVPPAPPSPIPLDGFRVLIVYETADLSKLPAAQQSVLYGAKVREYLNSKCVVGLDGKTREWRLWDQHVDVAAEAKHWQDALKRTKQSIRGYMTITALPWIIVSNGRTGYEGPLPEDTEKTLELLKKYGG